jgi:hypothetical protein
MPFSTLLTLLHFSHFLEKSQNEWAFVDSYCKVPGGPDLVEMDVDEKKIDAYDQLDPSASKSLLPVQTREIISLFFNVRLMAKELAEFDVRTWKFSFIILLLF